MSMNGSDKACAVSVHHLLQGGCVQKRVVEGSGVCSTF